MNPSAELVILRRSSHPIRSDLYLNIETHNDPCYQFIVRGRRAGRYCVKV